MCYRTKDSWRLVRIHENRLILWKLTGLVINDSKRIFLSQDLWSTIRYKSMIYFLRPVSNLFGVRIRDHDMIPIHVFTNLLYHSRNLNYFSFLSYLNFFRHILHVIHVLHILHVLPSIMKFCLSLLFLLAQIFHFWLEHFNRFLIKKFGKCNYLFGI